MKASLFSYVISAALSFATIATASKPVENDTISSKKAEISERNVMLNASDANKPREIQIGLPSEDVNVYENGLPAVYSSAVHKLATHWRSDASLGEVGLMTPSESAIATGNIAYSVNSFSKLGQKEFKGVLNYRTNHFGWQNIDMNVSGGIGNRWLYTASIYQNFDPGSFSPKFENFSDRTQLYHAGLTRLFNNNRGRFSVIYKFSKSSALGSMINAAPFIYVGDGSVKEIPGFKLGTSSYAPEANYVDFGGSNINKATVADGLFQDGSEDAYTGLVEGRRTWLHLGKVKNALLTSELKKKIGDHDVRLGLNEWFYHLDYHSSSFQWVGTVTEYPQILNRVAADGSTAKFSEFNELSPEYTKGTENKLAAYFTDNWQVSPKFTVYYGARLEYYRMSADQIPYGRYSGFHIGDTHEYTDNQGNILSTEKIQPQKVVKDKLNYAATAQFTYKLTKNFGLTADGTVATRFPRINEYAGTGPTEEQYKRVTIPLLRGGLFYQNDWINLTSMITYISKSNNIDQQNVTKPGTTQSKTTLLIYDIKTLGWTTSAEINPFKGFHLHTLFTYQKPTYNNYFIKSPFEGVPDLNANGNIVKEIPQILAEIDPSYNITPDLRLWLSFRYFGKTYANLTNALYFNGRWETFGGVNWKVNKHLSLGATVVNFLNQKGASGTISGAELLGKEEAGKFKDHYMSGNYLRPFTLEFSASLSF